MKRFVLALAALALAGGAAGAIANKKKQSASA